LNLICGKQAIASTAYSAAVDYVGQALAILPQNSWAKKHGLSFSIYLEQAKAQYLAGNYNKAEELYPTLLNYAQNNEEHIAIYLIQIEHFLLSGNYAECVTSCRRGIELHGVAIPESEEEMEKILEQELALVDKNLHSRDPHSLLNLQAMTAKKLQTLMKCLDILFTSSYFLGLQKLCRWGCVKMTNLSLQYGHIPLSGTSYVNYGFVLSQMGQYDRA